MALATRLRVDESLVAVVGPRRRRSSYRRVKNGFKAVLSGVKVDGGFKCLDVKGLFDSAFDPILLHIKGDEVA